jgi:tripartite-type tricarboxylate transporter receptor subunit TctC
MNMWIVGGLLLAVISAITSVAAQDYPAKPIRIIVPYAPGGGLDVVGRPLTLKMAETLGQPVIMDNRPGAGTVIGTQVAAKAPADGYTLLLTLSALTISPSLNASLPYDPVKDFAPVIWIGTSSYILSVHPSVPAGTVKQLIALSKAAPDKFNYSSPGNGTDPHMAGELFKVMAGVKWIHIPFSGGGPAATAVMGGQIDLTFLPTSVGTPFVKAGKLKALGISTVRRSAQWPELPTIAESGVPGYDATAWSGLLAPAGTPRDIVARLNATIAKIVQTPEYRKLLEDRLVEPVGSSTEQFAVRIRDDVAKWRNVVKQGRIKTE